MTPGYVYVICVGGRLYEELGAFLVEEEARLAARSVRREATELNRALGIGDPDVTLWQLSLHSAGGHWVWLEDVLAGPLEAGHAVPRAVVDPAEPSCG